MMLNDNVDYNGLSSYYTSTDFAVTGLYTGYK